VAAAVVVVAAAVVVVAAAVVVVVHNEQHTPFHDMLPHLYTIYDDVILLNVLTKM